MFNNLTKESNRGEWEKEGKVFLMVDTWIDDNQAGIVDDELLAGTLTIKFETKVQVRNSMPS